MPHPNVVMHKPAYTFTNSNGTWETVVPADLATIYNLNPLFTAGITSLSKTKSGDKTPTISKLLPFSVRLLPMTFGSPPKRLCHAGQERTAASDAPG